MKLKDFFKPSFLGYKLMFRIVFFSAGLALIATLIQLYIDFRWDIKTVHSSLQQIQATRLDSLAANIWDMNSDQINTNLQEITKLPDIVRVELTDNLGEYYESTREQPGKLHIKRVYPIFLKTDSRKKVGTLVVFASLEGVYERLAGKALVILAAQTVKTFFVSFFILFITHTIILRRLDSLALMARSLETDDQISMKVSNPMTPNSPDELDDIATVLQEMCSLTKERTKKLSESEKKYKLLIEATNTGYVIINGEGIVIDANQEYIRMTGNRDLEEILGRPVTDWTAPYDVKRNAREVHKCLNHGSTSNIQIDYQDAHGHIIPIEINAAVLPDNQHPRIFSICHDITRRKMAETEKAQLQEELRQAQKMEAIGRLAGGVAHDFNNMLGVIIGHVDMLLLEIESDHPFYGALHDIRKAAGRSAELTVQLLAFARKQTVKPIPLDLNDSIAGMLDILKRLIGENIEMNWAAGEKTWPVLMDPGQLNQVLTNLCVNARDAITGTGRINITTGNVICGPDNCTDQMDIVPGDYILLSVSDTGSGMDQETLSSIFEPFFTTKGLGKGTGLGLATVYGIVKQNGGFIKVESSPGEGTSFKILLPRSKNHDEQSDVKTTSAGAITKGNEKILLVEDELAILKITALMLQHLGYTVLPSNVPDEAIRITKEHPEEIHLLLSDVVMPGMNGVELARNISALRPGIKNLFMTGYSDDVFGNRGIMGKSAHLISKPFTQRQLAEKIRYVLDND